MEGALSLLMEEGMQSLTIKNISTQNKISEAAIYRHFSYKHAILMALSRLINPSLNFGIISQASNV